MTVGINAKKIKRTALIFVIVFLTVMLAVKPEVYIKSVFSGILLFCTAVLPSLFPFFFFTKALTSLGAADAFSKAFKKPLKKLYDAPPVSAYIFVMSILSGYPVGAKLLSDCRKSGLISARQARTVAAFTSTSGPLFILGTVAINMFHNKLLGILVMVCHFAAALLNGFIYRPYNRKNRRPCDEETTESLLPAAQDKMLSDCVYDAIISVLCVGGYIAIFSMVVDVAINTGALKIAAFLPSLAFGAVGIDARYADGIAAGFLEVTRGCLEVSALAPPIALALPIVTFMISFGGVSIFAQSLNFISECGISTARFLLMKATHAAIALTLALLVSLAL